MRKRSLRLYGFRNARAVAVTRDGIEKKLYIYAPEVGSLIIRRTVYNTDRGEEIFFLFYRGTTYIYICI